jgi:hypothetical protein
VPPSSSPPRAYAPRAGQGDRACAARGRTGSAGWLCTPAPAGAPAKKLATNLRADAAFLSPSVAPQHYPDAVLLGGDEVLVGRTVNAKTGVCLPLAQARVFPRPARPTLVPTTLCPRLACA